MLGDPNLEGNSAETPGPAMFGGGNPDPLNATIEALQASVKNGTTTANALSELMRNIQDRGAGTRGEFNSELCSKEDWEQWKLGLMALVEVSNHTEILENDCKVWVGVSGVTSLELNPRQEKTRREIMSRVQASLKGPVVS